MGAELSFFSPIHDSELPEADSLYLPGGYPELHHVALAANLTMQASIRRTISPANRSSPSAAACFTCSMP